jgi:ATP phosphoribosyltransferase
VCTSDYSRLVRLHSRSFRGPSNSWTGFLFSTTHLMLKIALPNKGRLADDSRELFGDAGLPVLSRGDRALTASLGGEFEALFVRAQDIPEFVADGVADVGVTGWDLVCEAARPLERRLDLGFGECRLIAAARDDSDITNLEDIASGSRIATSFPNITRDFFQARNQKIEIVPISGAAEIAPLLGIAEIIVDITSTGSTLKVNGLREIGTLLTSRAQLVTKCDTVFDQPKSEALDSLIMALDSVVKARGKRYLMANIPRKSLDAVKKIIPGINGPTVIDILNGGDRVAVHAVVDAAKIYKTMSALKALDATGILVTRVERLLP